MENDARTSSIHAIFSVFSGIFIAMFVAARLFGLMRDALCYSYLGCNAGFFGYDGALHFVSGFMVASGIVWFFKRNQKASMLGDKPWKNILLILAIAALIAVTWEMLEFIYDHIRMDIFHINLTNPNQMSQASNSDTMGDMSLGLIGTLICSWWIKLKRLI